jgi:hypothetical protein
MRPGNYAFDHAIQVLVNLRIQEAQYAKTQVPEHGIALLIARSPLLAHVLPAIEFDYQTVFQTREIDDISRDRYLPPYVQPLRLQRTKMYPELCFFVCKSFSERSRSCDRHIGCGPTPPGRFAATLPLRGGNIALHHSGRTPDLGFATSLTPPP